jgi:hypothetical protein
MDTITEVTTKFSGLQCRQVWCNSANISEEDITFIHRVKQQTGLKQAESSNLLKMKMMLWVWDLRLRKYISVFFYYLFPSRYTMVVRPKDVAAKS